MAMPISVTVPPRSLWTVADLEQLPDDGNRYEILHGELLVTSLPSADHQRAALALAATLFNWCSAHTQWTCMAPGGVPLDNTSWLAPDIAVYPVPPQVRGLSWRELPPPVLVIEIISPSTAKIDRHRKRPAYLANGVDEVWLVDIDTRTIERWTAASEFPEPQQGSITWAPTDAVPSLVIEADALFGRRV